MAVAYQSKDTAWKEILEAYFKEFIALCLPDLDKLIDWLIHLPKAFEIEYRETVYQWEENNMAYISSIERFGIQKGLQQGRQEGEYALLLSYFSVSFMGYRRIIGKSLKKLMLTLY
ncbi:putative cytosolic protein [Coxiella burnetii str. Namibia]|nr:putative cytosolic protein [Coxiella burnetii str. Namibia]